MGLLWLVTVGWAFSFSLIGEYLAGSVDNHVSVMIRVALAFLVFLPLLARARVALGTGLRLAGIGAIQIGLMYLCLFHAFDHLSVPEVLLFTVLTPLYVTLVDEIVTGRRRLPVHWWLAALVAVAGALVIRYERPGEDFWVGLLLIQGANLCFAAGQVFYKRMELGPTFDQVRAFGWFFAGALVVAGLSTLLFADFDRMPSGQLQWGVLLWLGVGASGLGYLGWNLGARRVNTGQLAAMNNMLIPAGILVNVLIWNRDADLLRLAFGGLVLLLAVWIAGRAELAKEPA